MPMGYRAGVTLPIDARPFDSDDVSRIEAVWTGACRDSRQRERRCLVVPVAESTQDEVRRLVGPPGSPDLLVVASSQTRARGTRGRSWFHAGDKDLGFSFSIEPSGDALLLPILCCVAVRQALIASLREAMPDLVDTRLRLKWPNDVLYEDLKLAGILIESEGPGRWVVGIGINVNQDDFSAELRQIATSMATIARGRRFDRTAVLCAVLRNVLDLLRRSEDSDLAILALYEAGLGLVGCEVDMITRRSGAGASAVRGVLESVSTRAVRLIDGRSFAPGEVEAISSAKR